MDERYVDDVEVVFLHLDVLVANCLRAELKNCCWKDSVSPEGLQDILVWRVLTRLNLTPGQSRGSDQSRIHLMQGKTSKSLAETPRGGAVRELAKDVDRV